MNAPKIEDLRAREILDSRGNPTIEVDVILENGIIGRASVPSGASTGSREAVELRDGCPGRYRGKGVLGAVNGIHDVIREALIGRDVCDQDCLDRVLIALDGTPDKGRLGANALLGVSLASAYAGSAAAGQPLYEYLGSNHVPRLPVPLMNVLNGGQHAANNINVQEFMIVPAGAPSFKEALRWGAEIYHQLKDQLSERGLACGVGDEGGYAPDLEDDEEALELLMGAILAAGYEPGQDVWLALDVAASELCSDGARYQFREEFLSASGLIDRYRDWCARYPILSIEDGLDENDWEGWKALTKALGETVQLVGDDLFVTDSRLLRAGYEANVANAILIKPNQIGTVTETLETLWLAESIGYSACISHRSGETADSFISDLAVLSGAGQIKSGAPCRTDRVEKYNQLLRIEEVLGDDALFAGINAFVLK